MSQHLRHAGRRSRMAMLCAPFLAIPASAAAMQTSARLPGPEACDAGPVDRSDGAVRPAPRLIGLTLEQAEAALASLEIRPIVVRSTEPLGTVVNQWPAPGEPVLAGPDVSGSVWLCVSNGEAPPPILMPDLAGRTVEQAQRMLRARRIANAPIIRRSENAEPAGTVYGQSPPADAEVTADDAIVLNVSEGPRPPEQPPAVAAPPVQPSAAEAQPRVDPADGFVETEPPPSAPQRDLTRVALPGILLAIALLAAGLMTRSHLAQARPRFRVTMAGVPMASVDWGDPPEPGFECRLVPPVGRCRLELDDGAVGDD